jgi:hypothetical protein
LVTTTTINGSELYIIVCLKKLSVNIAISDIETVTEHFPWCKERHTANNKTLTPVADVGESTFNAI